MEGHDPERDPEEYEMSMRPRMNEKGVALVTALLMSVAIMAMVVGVLYMINQSTAMSGAGKRYATAAEAADGAVELAKDAINMTMWNDTPALSNSCFQTALMENNTPCVTEATLLSTAGGEYNATITIVRLFSIDIPGGRLEFARSTGGAPSRAVYFRITAKVAGPNNTSAENSALYRFAG